ncbi:MAG: aldehyde dehydrogenase (NAD+) [Verrucomicrobiales bacterium]
MQIQDRYGLFIGGKFVKPKSGKYFRSIIPATEKPLTRIAQANASDVDKAVNAARIYFGLHA